MSLMVLNAKSPHREGGGGILVKWLRVTSNTVFMAKMKHHADIIYRKK